MHHAQTLTEACIAALQWQLDMGINEAVATTPSPWRIHAHVATQTAPAPDEPARIMLLKPVQQGLGEAIAEAHAMANAAHDITMLKRAVEQFNGCALKKTAINTVFAAGMPESGIMLIGDAPSADEDREGVPFCGASGDLLNRMLATISLNRATNCYVTNTLFWRPPGNRQPTPEEMALCLPFVQRHIQLVQPKLLILLGGTAMKTLMPHTQSITRVRGKPQTYTHEQCTIPARVIFHPSYLLRQPLSKRETWHDLLEIQAWLKNKELHTEKTT
jgi:uracil-DNA glycosylase